MPLIRERILSAADHTPDRNSITPPTGITIRTINISAAQPAGVPKRPFCLFLFLSILSISLRSTA